VALRAWRTLHQRKKAVQWVADGTGVKQTGQPLLDTRASDAQGWNRSPSGAWRRLPQPPESGNTHGVVLDGMDVGEGESADFEEYGVPVNRDAETGFSVLGRVGLPVAEQDRLPGARNAGTEADSAGTLSDRVLSPAATQMRPREVVQASILRTPPEAMIQVCLHFSTRPTICSRPCCVVTVGLLNARTLYQPGTLRSRMASLLAKVNESTSANTTGGVQEVSEQGEEVSNTRGSSGAAQALPAAGRDAQLTKLETEDHTSKLAFGVPSNDAVAEAQVSAKTGTIAADVTRSSSRLC